MSLRERQNVLVDKTSDGIVLCVKGSKSLAITVNEKQESSGAVTAVPKTLIIATLECPLTKVNVCASFFLLFSIHKIASILLADSF